MGLIRKTEQYFLCYSFLGWILEGLFNLVTQGRFRKANFLHGPIKPMYGFGALALLSSYWRNPKRLFYASCWLPCLVEFCSGYWLERCFALRYWDYRQEFGQFKGYICLKFALCWVILAQLLIKVVHPVVQWVLRGIDRKGKISHKLMGIFLADVAVTYYQRRYGSKRVINHG